MRALSIKNAIDAKQLRNKRMWAASDYKPTCKQSIYEYN
jgi:hypothetical protein